MRRNYKETKIIAVSFNSYLARLDITAEQLVKNRQLKSAKEINDFLSKIGVEKLKTSEANKILRTIKQNSTLNKVKENSLTNQEKKVVPRKKTKSSKITNNTLNVDNSAKELDKIAKTLNTDTE